MNIAAQHEHRKGLRALARKTTQSLSMTVIIPVRITHEREDILERLENYKFDRLIPDNVHVLIVDDGSRPEYASRIEEICTRNNLQFLSTGRPYYQNFNLAKARNIGAQHATTELVAFLDVDLIPYDGFFARLQYEAEAIGMRNNATPFLMCPVIYLTESGFKDYLAQPAEYRLSYAIGKMCDADEACVEKFSTGTSVVVLRRDYFLMRGGNDTRFSGWGFEDYEFNNRLIRRYRKFPMPRDWAFMDGNFMKISQFRGWKSVYRIYGNWLAQKGVWLIHQPHAISASNQAAAKANWQLLCDRMAEDADKGKGEPEALGDVHKGRTLLMHHAAFTSARALRPAYGEIVQDDQELFRNSRSIANYLKSHKINNIVFSNPYRAARDLRLYNWCRKNGFPFIVCERGALPDSVLVDDSGFLNDSRRFDAAYWDRPLSRDEEASIQAYISQIRFGSEMLEQQAERKAPHAIRRRLGIRADQKILLVPFQQPNDTVIRHFSGPVGNFGKFYNTIERVVRELGDEWVVLTKKHPVEDELAPIEGAISVDDDNIYDLIELCDAVALINSGVGLYAMMFGKPVYILGESWYANPAMNVSISDPDQVAVHIRAGFVLDYDKVQRFTHYLRHHYYSFGKQTQRRVRYPDGSPITATTEIDIYELQLPDAARIFIRPADRIVSTTSPLFDRYVNETAQIDPAAKAPSSRSAPAMQQQNLVAPTPRGTKARKLRKLRESPYRFFRDTRIGILRPLRFVFRSDWRAS